MNTFTDAVVNQEARTENNMAARKSTANACVDLFFKIGASRGQDIIPGFVAALVENEDVALRIAQWARDVRGGAGERQLFRNILNYLETNRPECAVKLLTKIPEIGRWDDVFTFNTPELITKAYSLLKDALVAGNGLAAKWTPRKGHHAEEFRKFLSMSPKFYRKSLVALTRVVEQQMCSKDWDNINFSHVPSLASSRYKKAFTRHTEKFSEYVAALSSGDKTVKVNAGAVYPYDVLKGVSTYSNKTETDHIIAQWNALENFVDDAKILPIVDVSGSMLMARAAKSVSCLDVAVSLGLYLSEKNRGVFKDTFLTFSETPELLNLKGNVIERLAQMKDSDWRMNTNLHRAMELILKTAIKGLVPQEEMPEMLLILSDMQFDYCVEHDDSALKMVARKFAYAGYQLPKIVFWNLKAYNNVPVKFNTEGVALVSGFSPAIMKPLLSGKEFTPEAVMMHTVMIPRYDV